jgi:prepilin-type N-terminal cleavage/methylation domain-containing protein
MKSVPFRFAPCRGFVKGFSLVEMLLAIVVAAVLIEAAVRISVSETRSSITTHLVQSLRGDADRIINFIRLDMAEADAVFTTDQGKAACTDGARGVQNADVLLLKIRHPFVKVTTGSVTTRSREFVYVCYYERLNPQSNQNWDLWRFGPPYGVATDTTTAFNGSNYLSSGFLNTAGTPAETLVRRMTTLRPAGATPGTPTVSADFSSLLYSLQVSSQNVAVGSLWNKTYLVPGISATTAGRCVSPGAKISATDQSTANC